jgi:hypothetical protein
VLLAVNELDDRSLELMLHSGDKTALQDGDVASVTDEVVAGGFSRCADASVVAAATRAEYVSVVRCLTASTAAAVEDAGMTL